MNGIYDVLKNERKAKMEHPIPSVPVIERERYILQKAKGKTVLDIGASGPLHDAIVTLAKKCHSLNLAPPADYIMDIDKVDFLPALSDLDLVIAGEVIEHLDNAGHFLQLLKQYTCPIIITTPNAFSAAAHAWLKKGIEQVNIDHKCWYSYTTFKTIATKYGYNVKEWFWYNGKPLTAEGMLFLLEG